MQRRDLVQSAVGLALAARRAHRIVDVGLGHCRISLGYRTATALTARWPTTKPRPPTPASALSTSRRGPDTAGLQARSARWASGASGEPSAQPGAGATGRHRRQASAPYRETVPRLPTCWVENRLELRSSSLTSVLRGTSVRLSSLPCLCSMRRHQGLQAPRRASVGRLVLEHPPQRLGRGIAAAVMADLVEVHVCQQLLVLLLVVRVLRCSANCQFSICASPGNSRQVSPTWKARMTLVLFMALSSMRTICSTWAERVNLAW